MYRCPPIRVKRAACTWVLCACLGSLGKVPIRRYSMIASVQSWPSAWFASMVLQVEASATEGFVCTCIGNNMASLMEREAAMPARASAHPFSVRLIFSIVHSVNRCSVSLTLVRYRVMRSSLASYSFWTCLTTSWDHYRPRAWRQTEPG